MIDKNLYGDIIETSKDSFNLWGSERLNNTVRYLVDAMEEVNPEAITSQLAQIVTEELPQKTDLVYANTELAKKRDKTVLIPLADFAQDAKEAMTGGSVAVIGEDMVLTNNIVNHQVTPLKTNFIKEGKNKLNKATIINGETIATGGDVIVSGTSKRTDYIYLEAGTYTYSNDQSVYVGMRFVVYDLNKVYETIQLTNPVLTIASPKFIILCDKIEYTNLQIELGDTPTTYEDYFLNIDYLKKDIVETAKRTVLGEWGYLVTETPVILDRINKKIKFSAGGYNYIYWRDKFKNLGTESFDVDYVSSGLIFYDITTDTIKTGLTVALNENCVIIGYIHSSSYYFSGQDKPINIENGTITPEMLSFVIDFPAEITVVSKHKDKQFANFGDSITWYDGELFSGSHIEVGQLCKGYQYYMREQLLCLTDNQGVSGSTMPGIYNVINNYDFVTNAPDAVTITSGANDHMNGILPGTVLPVGSVFTTTTFAGALQASVEKILNTNRAIYIYLMCPIKGWYDVVQKPDCYNGESIISEEYINIMKQIGELYSIPVLDWYHLSRINDITKDVLIGDNPAVWTAYQLHPTNLGFERMASLLIPFLNNN